MADYKFLQHIDGAWRQLKRWVMYKYSGTPSDAQEGSFWYDTATKTPKYHNGTIAKDIGKYVVAGTGTTVSASGNDLAVNVTYGTVANSSCVGNDSRLSNARTPISHAVSATTYGVGTSSNYGHVKLYTSIGNNTDGAPTNSAVSGALALKANVSQLTDGSVTKVGTASVGSTTVPVYVNAGTLTACSGTLGVSITGNSATATTATKLGSSTVGSASQPIYLNAGSATVCNGSVGSATQPTYVDAGVNTACSDTLAVSITGNAATATKVGTSSVGSTTQPVYINAGTLTACSGTLGVSITGNAATATKVGTSSVGSTTQPVYVNAGTLTACSGTLGVSITGNAATATTATKLGSSTVGSTSQPIYLNAGVATACNGSVGSATQPTYVNAGVNTACSGTLAVSVTGNAATATTATKLGSTTVGSTTQPIYLNAGVPTAITGSIDNSTTGNAATATTATKLGSTTVGSTSQPIYLNAGVPTAITGTISNSTTGNAATATKLGSARTIALTGDVTGSANFDGSVNVSVAVTSAHLASNTGSFAPWQTKGSKGNYTGISAPGALRVNFMSRTDANYAGLHCETDSKWMVLRNADGTLKTDYAPATTSNSNEIATTAFVNSRINAQSQEYTHSIYNSGPSMVYATKAFVIACNLVENQAHQAEAILSFSVVGNTTAANNYAGRVYMACKAQGTNPTYNVQILEGTSNIDNLLKWRSDQGASGIYCTIMFAIHAYARVNLKLDSLNGGGTWTSAFDSTLASSWTSYGTLLTYSVPTASNADKLGTTTVGSIYKPVYFSNGVPVLTEADAPSKILTVANSNINWTGGIVCYYTSGSSPITVNLDNAPRGCILTLLTTDETAEITLNRTSSTFYVSGWNVTPTSVTLTYKGSVQFIIAPDFARVYVLRYLY